MARIDATRPADRLRCETESQHASGRDRGGPGIARNYRAAVAACPVGAADTDRGLVAAVVGRFIGRGRRATLASTAANALRDHTVRLRAERHNRGDIVRRDGTANASRAAGTANRDRDIKVLGHRAAAATGQLRRDLLQLLGRFEDFRSQAANL